jgi:hypothetical protein
MTDQASGLVSDGEVMSDTASDRPSDTGSDTLSDGDWLRKAAAAARLGISERALDRQLAAGKWPKRMTDDGRVEVYVARPPAEGQREAERALVLVERFQQQLEVQTGPLIARIEALARENGALQNRVQTLEAQLAASQTLRPTPATTPWWATFWPWRRAAE